MKIALAFLPFIISWFIGYLLTLRLLKQDPQSSFLVSFFLAAGLGLGISSEITFVS